MLTILYFIIFTWLMFQTIGFILRRREAKKAHDTLSTEQWKNDIIKYLVEEKGFTVSPKP